MKTAVSIPDKVFKSAEELASRQGKSRSRLYTQALSNYLDKYRNENIVLKLNKVYGSDNSKLDPALRSLQARSLPKDRW